MIRRPLYLLVPGLLLTLGAGGTMAYHRLVVEPPSAAAPAGAVAGLAAAASLVEVTPLGAIRGLIFGTALEQASLDPALGTLAGLARDGGRSSGAPAVRHGAEGLGGSGRFSCAIEDGVRRCRSGG